MSEGKEGTVELLHRELTYQIIGAFREGYNGLGWGFLNFGPTPQHRRMIWTRHRG